MQTPSKFPFTFTNFFRFVAKTQFHIKNKQWCLAADLCSPLNGLTNTNESRSPTALHPRKITGRSPSYPCCLTACSIFSAQAFIPILICDFLAGYQPLFPSLFLTGSLSGTLLASFFSVFLFLSFTITLSKCPSVSPNKHKQGRKWTTGRRNHFIRALCHANQGKTSGPFCPCQHLLSQGPFGDLLPLHNICILNAHRRQALGMHAKAICAVWKIWSLTSGWTKEHWKF